MSCIYKNSQCLQYTLKSQERWKDDCPTSSATRERERVHQMSKSTWWKAVTMWMYSDVDKLTKVRGAKGCLPTQRLRERNTKEEEGRRPATLSLFVRDPLGMCSIANTVKVLKYGNEKSGLHTMFVCAFCNKSTVLSNSSSQYTYGSSHIKEITWAFQNIHYELGWICNELSYGIGLARIIYYRGMDWQVRQPLFRHWKMPARSSNNPLMLVGFSGKGLGILGQPYFLMYGPFWRPIGVPPEEEIPK